MTLAHGILRLSNELLRDILDHIEADPDRGVNLDRRAYLSQESFRLPPPLPIDNAETLGNFRLTCKRFAELGAIHQFARVTTRFSIAGFRRLEKIAQQRHLARHVKKFSYMVPYFYVEGREHVDILPSLLSNFSALDAARFGRKVREQRHIVNSQEDLRVLKTAISAFTSLQHVQILRVQDEEDATLLNYIRHHQNLLSHVEPRWGPACSHSTRTIATALMASKSPCTRFSSPMLSTQSATLLASHRPTSFARLVEQFTCLEIHFDDGTDLDDRMRNLSDLFKFVFTAAVNMQAVHVGFPNHRPLNLRLEEIFHNVRWERLVAFGIQAWRLDADEIIQLAHRHRDRLKGLRLRDVFLREGSMWKDVLYHLRRNMTRLDWVSLRRIGYAKHFDEEWAALGAEVPDDPPGGASESDDEDDTLTDISDDIHGSDNGVNGVANDQFSSFNHVNGYDDNDDFDDNANDDDDSDDALSDDDTDDDEHGPSANELGFPVSFSPDTPPSVPWCNCSCDTNGVAAFSADELGDNGLVVSNTQRKMWEKWVVRQCPRHDESEKDRSE